MNKQMLDVRVRTEDEFVYIEQPHFENVDDSSIMLHPDQVDLLIQWLGEARDEIVIKGVLDE